MTRQIVRGTAPTDPVTGAFKGTTIQEQTRQCLTNIQAILEVAGSCMDKTVDVTVVMADEDEFGGMNEEWLQWFPVNPPARQGANSPLAHRLTGPSRAARLPTMER